MMLPGILGIMTGMGIAAVAAVGIIYYMNRQSEQTHTRSNYRRASPNYSPYREPDPDALCSICLETPDGFNRTQLHCGHVFHRTCIGRWQQTDTRCPNCREKL